MVDSISNRLLINPEVKSAIKCRKPVVALETAVVTHGLPKPVNLQLADEMEDIIRTMGVIPASIGMIDGKIHVGMTHDLLIHLSETSKAVKISQRDFGPAMTLKLDGGTTVAGTAIIAHLIGINVFATGGIGGVHREAPFDISADLPVLGHTPLIVVCAGAKAILDLPATVEYLETMGVPVLGYQTDELPAFYSSSSGLPVSQKVDCAEQVAEIAHHHFDLGLKSAILVVVPPPHQDEIPAEEIEREITTALNDAHRAGVRGAAMTPYLLRKIGELTGGRSMKTNLALLKNNARVAAEIALAMIKPEANIKVV